jgi:hypothetical protein
VQAVLHPVDVGHLGEVRRGDELAVQPVGPGVVRALQVALDLARRLGAQLRATVPADVEERAQPAVPPADDQDALPPDLDLPEGAWLVEVGGADRAEPHPLEDELLLTGEDVGVGVVVAGRVGMRLGPRPATGRPTRRARRSWGRPGAARGRGRRWWSCVRSEGLRGDGGDEAGATDCAGTASSAGRRGSNRPIGWAVVPVVARSASTSPTTGTNLKPCPEKPHATVTLACAGCCAMTKCWSAVLEYMHVAASR